MRLGVHSQRDGLILKISVDRRVVKWKNVAMLAKADKKEIGEIVTDKLGEFLENVLGPYLDREYIEVKKDIAQIREDVNERVDGLNEYIKDHEKRIRKLERVTNIN